MPLGLFWLIYPPVILGVPIQSPAGLESFKLLGFLGAPVAATLAFWIVRVNLNGVGKSPAIAFGQFTEAAATICDGASWVLRADSLSRYDSCKIFISREIKSLLNFNQKIALSFNKNWDFVQNVSADVLQ